MTSHDQILERLQGYATARAITVASLVPLSQAQLDYAPKPGTWSIGENADHLLLAEQLYGGEIAKLIALAREGREPRVSYTFKDIDVRPFGMPVQVLSCVERPFGAISRNLPDPVRRFLTETPLFPAKNPSIAAPRAGRARESLLDDLRAAHARTAALVHDNADLDLASMQVSHPVTGDTGVGDILLFLARHEGRHQKQMERVRLSAGFPTA